MSSPHPQTVKNRRVFYIPGYDPIHPRRYRELYRSEGAAQAAISGYDLTLKPRTGGSHYGWQIDTMIDDATTHADVEVLVWSDIVRDSMDASIPGTYLQMVRTAWTYLAQAAISGYDLTLKPRTGGSHYGWQIDTMIDDATTHADVEVLVWSDIVRDSMDASIPGTYLQMVRTAWTYIASEPDRKVVERYHRVMIL